MQNILTSRRVKHWARSNKELAKKTGLYLHKNRRKPVAEDSIRKAVSAIGPKSSEHDQLVAVLEWASMNRALASETIVSLYKELR